MTSIGIIGAGITGLTAAFRLRQSGQTVAVYEAASRTGGVICSHREGPWLAEGGPNTILETSPQIPALLEELGLTSRRVDSDPAASARYVVRGGRPVGLPASGPAFFRSPLFSTGAKLRLLAEPFIRRGPGDDESVASFVRRRLGQEFLDYAIDPLVTGIYAGDPASLSVVHAFPRIHALEERYGSLIRGQIFGARERKRRGDVSKATAKKFSFDEGLQVLPDTLHNHLRDQVRLNTRVLEIRLRGDRWELTAESAGALTRHEHRAILFCGTAHSLARLTLHAEGAPALGALSTVAYPPVTSVVLGFRRSDVDHPCSGFGMLIPHCEGFGILGTIFSSSLFRGRAPADHLTLTTYVGGARNAGVALLPDTDLLNVVRTDLGRLLGVRGEPVFRHVTRWPAAIPQYEVGYGRHKDLLTQLETRAPGLFVAGHFRDGVALSDSLHTGGKAAERVAAWLQSGLSRNPHSSSEPTAAVP